MSCDDEERCCAEEYDECAEERAAGAEEDDACLLPLWSNESRIRFVDTSEWKWAKTTCAGLFCVLGRYYDELWFPTALNEWCELYYQCNHADHYWQRREAWLKGDEQVREAVWSQVLEARARRDRQMRNRCNADESRTADPARIFEMRKLVDEGNDRIVMKRMKAKELACDDKEEPTAEERARAETEAAELALADPNEDPNWVEMRRRMRGSFAGLNLARCEVSSELLVHMMIELCHYWSTLPCIDYEIEPLLERNIIREIQNFRFRLFGKPTDIQQRYVQSSPRFEGEREEYREPSPDVCREPAPDVCREQAPDVRCEQAPEVRCEQAPEVRCEQAPAQPPCAPKAKRPKSRSLSRGPATNKLAEARAKQNAARIRALDEKK